MPFSGEHHAPPRLSLIPIAQDRVDAYRALAERMAKPYLEHGARSYTAHVGDDLDVAEQGAVPFPITLDLGERETLVVATRPSTRARTGTRCRPSSCRARAWAS